jgi:hypothetical protein
VRWLIFSLALVSTGCAESVEVASITSSDDYSGLSTYERSQFDWAAVEIKVPAKVARSIRRWQLSNVWLDVFRCDNPANAYPAPATMAGNLFDYNILQEPLADHFKLIFYLPQHVQDQERYDCAALQARGYSPVFLRGQTLRLPKLHFGSLRPAERIRSK